MPKSKLFLVFIFGFLGGIFCGTYLADEYYMRAIMAFISCIFVVYKFMEFEKKKIIILIVLLGICCGMFRIFIVLDAGNEAFGGTQGTIAIKGCVIDEPDIRSGKVKYVFETEDGNRILINVPKYPAYEYGDCLFVEGEMEKPGKIRDFDYADYLARYGIYRVMNNPSVTKVGVDKNFFFEVIYSIKNEFEQRISRVLNEPYSSFLGGLILGSRKSIPQELTAQFNITGLSHIVAISGYNVTLIIVFIGGLFSWMKRKMKIIFSMIFIVMFVILVGAGATVVRAGIMGTIGLLALWLGRQYLAFFGLMVAAFFMNLINPLIFVYDIGFQLSFTATLGLIFLSPTIQKYLKLEPIAMTVSAQIMSLPIIILNFGRLSLISPLANLIVLPLIPGAMLFGFLAVMISFVSDFFGRFVGIIAYIFLAGIILFVQILSKIAFASIKIVWFSWWIGVAYYYLIVRRVGKSFLNK